MNIARWLHQTACVKPHAPAVLRGAHVEFDYATLAGRAFALSRHWLSLGLKPGDRVAIFSPNRPEYLEALHACWWIGVAVIPVNYKLHPREVGWILENSEARLVLSAEGTLGSAGVLPAGCEELSFTSPAYQAAVRPEAPVVAPLRLEGDALAWVFYTSGTTGRPKGVMLSHANLAAATYAYALDIDQLTGREHSVYAAPMSHGAGLYSFGPIRAGAAHVIPESGGFEPEEIIFLAHTLGEVCLFAAPTMVKRLVQAAKANGYRGEGIKSIYYGGGPMYAADIDEALALFGPRFIQIYGQGESPMTITVLPRDGVADESHPRWRARRDSVGYAQAPVEVAVWDEALRPLPAGEIGEIVVRGPTVMQGYLGNPTASSETIVEGWLRTGDLGCLDEDGFLTLTGRSKDVIISGGTNIYPREVEDALLRHPAVHEVSVVGAMDAEWGESVVAFVVLDPDCPCAPDELDAWCRNEIAAFKRPKRYEIVETLPKNSYGKVLKTDLRRMLAGNGDEAAV